MPRRRHRFTPRFTSIPRLFSLLCVLAIAGAAPSDPQAPPNGPDEHIDARVSFTDDGGLRVTGSLGHSHNDYYRDEPLQQALDAGMLSIEADVYVRGNQLMVAHDRHEIRDHKTLRRLYLDPLMKAFKALGGTQPDHPFGGKVRDSGLPLILMVDFKSEGQATWETLEKILQDYPGLVRVITRQPDGQATLTPGPVIVVVSGNRPKQAMADATVRRSAYDGRYPADLNSDAPAHLMPMISTSYTNLIKHTRKDAPRPPADALTAFADAADARGRLARVWASPDNHHTWQAFQQARMQLINTDQPRTLGLYLQHAQAGVKPSSEE